MKYDRNILTTTMGKQVSLALLVLVVGVPINYQLFSSWINISSAPTNSSLSSLDDAVIVIPTIVTINTESKKNRNYSLGLDDQNNAGSTSSIIPNRKKKQEVRLSQAVINSLGVRTTRVKRETIYRQIESIGRISIDENTIHNVSLRVEGWVENIIVKSAGSRVEKNDLIFKIYSPKLINAQKEYLQALELGDEDNFLISASTDRLMALGFSQIQIDLLQSTRQIEPLFNIYAPQDGHVIKLDVHEGDFIPLSKSIISLVDLSRVWLLADVFESRISWVKIGQKVKVTLPFMPGKIWYGNVDFIYPNLDPVTRSVKIRLKFKNIDGILKPNMFANVSIFTSPKLSVLTVPREAVIKTGNQSKVILAEGAGKFRPVLVKTGIETNTLIEIVEGLRNNQKVVVSSQFLIDSESSIQVALMRINGH